MPGGPCRERFHQRRNKTTACNMNRAAMASFRGNDCREPAQDRTIRMISLTMIRIVAAVTAPLPDQVEGLRLSHWGRGDSVHVSVSWQAAQFQL